MSPTPLHRMPRPSRLAVAAVLAALPLAACGELTTAPDGAVPTVVAQVNAISAGSAVPLRLHNPTAVTWSYSACPGAFQRFAGGAWVDVAPALIVCTAAVTEIAAGETVDIGVFLATEAPAGTYRAQIPFGAADAYVVGNSNIFLVEAFPIGDAPVVSVLQSSAGRGEEITVRLVNPTTFAFGFNHCADGRLQRLVGDTWTDTPAPLMLCTAALHPLPAGAFDDETYPVFADLPAGTYRFRARLWRENADAITRYSNSFTVN